jgi:predicted nucleic acid-binding protein
MHRRHRQRSGSRRSLDEFMVGAHALLQCDGLITWNDTFYRDYFKGLKLIVPHA